MPKQKYPRMVDIYKGEGKIRIVPYLEHISPLKVPSNTYYVCEFDDVSDIGRRVYDSLEIIDKSPISTIPRDEVDKIRPTAFGSKYKTWKTFFKNNDEADVRLFENGEMKIYGGHGGEYPPITLTSGLPFEKVGEAVIEMFNIIEESRREYAERLFLPVPEIIELSGTSHLVEHVFKGADDSKYRMYFQIDDNFCKFKSHTWSEFLLHLYAPGYGIDAKRMAKETTFPRFSMLPCDDEVSKAIREFLSKGKFKGAIELVPISGTFLFKAKKEYHGNMMYFYAGGVVKNIGLCMTYPMSYVGTDNEKKLISVLDAIADSYKEERIC